MLLGFYLILYKMKYKNCQMKLCIGFCFCKLYYEGENILILGFISNLTLIQLRGKWVNFGCVCVHQKGALVILGASEITVTAPMQKSNKEKPPSK